MGDFRVVSAGDLADEIVKRLACNELPAGAAVWVRDQAKNGEHWGQTLIGYGVNPFCLYYKLKPDGKITLQLADQNLKPIWETTLRPAEAIA